MTTGGDVYALIVTEQALAEHEAQQAEENAPLIAKYSALTEGADHYPPLPDEDDEDNPCSISLDEIACLAYEFVMQFDEFPDFPRSEELALSVLLDPVPPPPADA